MKKFFSILIQNIFGLFNLYLFVCITESFILNKAVKEVIIPSKTDLLLLLIIGYWGWNQIKKNKKGDENNES
jgi:hypothetical protein